MKIYFGEFYHGVECGGKKIKIPKLIDNDL